jgi:hypothetical protein
MAGMVCCRFSEEDIAENEWRESELLTNAQDLSCGPETLSETEGPRGLDVSIANHFFQQASIPKP